MTPADYPAIIDALGRNWIPFGTFIGILVSAWISYRNSQKIEQVHQTTNSKMDLLLKTTAENARRQGDSEGADRIRQEQKGPTT